MNSRALFLFALLAISAAQRQVLGQSQAFLSAQEGTSAVDAKGVRHSEPARSGRLQPWIEDRVNAVAPDYPYAESAQHHTGAGRFRLQLDLKTGAVTRITVVKSTGFQTLDNCAVVALRQWRWRPGRWREIEMPVTFRLGSPPSRLPPSTVRLPKA